MAPPKRHRSVSQINQYERCPYSYKLSRIDKVWQRPAAWLAQGSAVHEAGEAWERSGRTMPLEDVQAVFAERYEHHINEACEITPNREYWFSSGPYRGDVDTERRFHIGLEQVEKMLKWYAGHPDEVVWIAPDGTPGIEIGFDIELDGILIRGFIDLVMWVETSPGVCEVIVRDNKTGNSPGDDFQLGVYGVALAEAYGIDPPQTGDYYMAGKAGKPGKPTAPYKIGYWTRERVVEKFQELEDNIAAERFEPLPEPDKCNFCDVATACEFSAG